jgi:sugar-specific transcriptional regulator TrmB
LVEKVIATPTKFRAVPIRDAIFILNEHRKTLELQRNAQELIRLFEHNSPNATVQNEKGKFRLIPKRDALILKKKEATSNAQESIDNITNWTAFQRCLDLTEEELKQGLERNVKIRSIVDKPKDAAWPEIAQTLMKHNAFSLGIIPHPPITRLAIYDKKKSILSTHLTPEIAGSSALMSTNPALTGIAQCYFDELWKNAKNVNQALRHKGHPIMIH